MKHKHKWSRRWDNRSWYRSHWYVCDCGRCKCISGMYHARWYYGWIDKWLEDVPGPKRIPRPIHGTEIA